MPDYLYTCQPCGLRYTVRRPTEGRNDPYACHVCGGAAGRDALAERETVLIEVPERFSAHSQYDLLGDRARNNKTGY